MQTLTNNTEAKMTGTALALIEGDNAITYFNITNGLDPIIEKIREEVKCVVIDISTKKGREECASLAHKIAKTKTAIDKRGKDLVADAKAQIKLVDAERARAWDEIEKIQHEVRRPLTEWEEADKKRIDSHEQSIVGIIAAGNSVAQNWQSMPLADMNNQLTSISEDKRDWQEFSARAAEAQDKTIRAISEAIMRREKYDAEQAELVRLRKEEAERKQREHEEKLKTEAAEKARKAAEEQARIAAEKEAARVKAEQQRLEQERLKAEREKQIEKERADKAERDRIVAEEKAKKDAEEAKAKTERDAKLAAERAEREKQEVIQKERDRVAAENKRIADEAAAREADKAHKAKINNEAVHDICKYQPDLTEADAKTLIIAIAKGEIRHVKISY